MSDDLKAQVERPRTKELHLICQLKMHESYTANDDFVITRVPGGWLYRGPVYTAFVPYKIVYADGDEF